MAAPHLSLDAAATPLTSAPRPLSCNAAQSSENPAEQALELPHQPRAGERHRILAVFAHPDDELGCIGSLRKHAERGDEVMLVWTTHGELASQFEGASDAYVRSIRQEHGAHIAELIGAAHHFFDFGDSRMTGGRDEALELAHLYARFRPDAIIAWSDDHPHPDHRMSAKIAFDAITLARIPKILAEGQDAPVPPHRQPVRFYQYPSAGSSYPLVHIDISAQIEIVKQAFSFYQAFYRWPFSVAQFEGGLAARGREVGVAYAEAFQLRQRFSPARELLV
jgi:LmbE family N-acetylglucosaminyl deacetylase